VIILGIDTGINGAMCILQQPRKKLQFTIFSLPIHIYTYGSKKRKMLDGREFRRLLPSNSRNSVLAYVEEPINIGGHRGETTKIEMSGAIKQILFLAGIPFTLVYPSQWQNRLWKNAAWVKDLPRKEKPSIHYIKKHYPQIDLIPPRSKTMSDGFADSACIALYGKTASEGDYE